MGRKWSFPVPYGHVGISSIGFGLVMAVISVGVGAGFNVGLASFMGTTDVPNAAIVTTGPTGGAAKPSSAGLIESKDSTKPSSAESNAPAEQKETASSSASSRVLQIAPSSPVDRIPNVGVVEPIESSLGQTPPSQTQSSSGEGAGANSTPAQASQGDSPNTLAQTRQSSSSEPSQASTQVQLKPSSDASVGDAQASANSGDG